MRVISGSARGTSLITIPGLETRPTTDRIKETLFNILQNELYDRRFLDLFAGSGAIGIEALSRGAACAVFVEQSKKAADCIRKNLEKTHFADKALIYEQEVSGALKRLAYEKPFDLIFMDPPYGQELEKKVLMQLKDNACVNEDTLFIVEASLDTKLDDVEEMGYQIVRIKQYKTNQHMFVRKAGH